MQRSRKEFSLLLFFYSLDPGDYKVTLQGSPDKPLGLYNWGMSRAAFDGHGDVVNYCILNGAKDWSWANKSAFAGHQMDLVKFFSKKLMECGHRFGQ